MAHGPGIQIGEPFAQTDADPWQVEKFIRVEKEHAIGLLLPDSVAIKKRVEGGFAGNRRAVREYREAQACLSQFLQNLDGPIDTAVVEQNVMIDETRVVTDENLDDIVLVQYA